jgi:DNA-binding NarL/FixJ family response regulator
MKTPELVFAEKFAAAALNWNLDKLYEDITDAKQRQGIPRRKPITPTEKACLRGLLSGYTPSEIALQLNREPVGLRVDLSRGLYRYIEMLTNSTPSVTG